MTPTPQDKSLRTMYQSCIQHLDSVTPRGTVPIHFYPDGSRNHYQICGRDLLEPLYIEFTGKQAEDAPIIFELIGQISLLKPIHPSQADASTEPQTHAKFWIECRPDVASRVFWHRIPAAFHAIAAQCDSPVDLSEVLEVDRDTGRILVCMKWSSVGEQSPFAKYTTLLPAHISGSSTSLHSLFPNMPVRVLFFLGYREKDEDETVNLEASLITVDTI